MQVYKKIFNLALKGGKSKQEIIEELIDNNILTPSVYLKEKYSIEVGKISRKWNRKMLDIILQNQIYIGSLVQYKKTRISHKTHNIVRVSEDEWVISKKDIMQLLMKKFLIKYKIFYIIEMLELIKRENFINILIF